MSSSSTSMPIAQLLPSHAEMIVEDDIEDNLSGQPSPKPELPRFNWELPSIDIWETYNKLAKRFDTEREKGWNTDLDVLLIVAALFASVTSSFCIFVLPLLREDSAATTQAILLHVSQQLANSTIPAATLIPRAPTDAWVRQVNILFLLSLGIDVIAVFLAMLAKQWVSEMNRGIERIADNWERALHRQHRYDGVEQWKLDSIIAALPTLLHLSILLFFAALSRMLYEYDRTSAIVLLSLFSLALAIYITTFCITVTVSNSPFIGPLNRAARNAIKTLKGSYFSHQALRQWRPRPFESVWYRDEYQNSRYNSGYSINLYEKLNQLENATSSLVIRALEFVWRSPGQERSWKLLQIVQESLPILQERSYIPYDPQLPDALHTFLNAVYSESWIKRFSKEDEIRFSLSLLDEDFQPSTPLGAGLRGYLLDALRFLDENTSTLQSTALYAVALKYDIALPPKPDVKAVRPILETFCDSLVKLASDPRDESEDINIQNDVLYSILASITHTSGERFNHPSRSLTPNHHLMELPLLEALIVLGNLVWEEHRTHRDGSSDTGTRAFIASIHIRHAIPLCNAFLAHFLFTVPSTIPLSYESPSEVLERFVWYFQVKVEEKLYCVASRGVSMTEGSKSHLDTALNVLYAYLAPSISLHEYKSDFQAVGLLKTSRLIIATLPQSRQDLRFRLVLLSMLRNPGVDYPDDYVGETLRLIVATLWPYALLTEVEEGALAPPCLDSWMGRAPTNSIVLQKQSWTLILLLNRLLEDALGHIRLDFYSDSQKWYDHNPVENGIRVVTIINATVLSRFRNLPVPQRIACRDLVTEPNFRTWLEEFWSLRPVSSDRREEIQQ